MTAHNEPTVQVFTRPRCSGCAVLKAALKSNGVAFTERDVTTPEGLALAMHYELPDSVPQVVFSGQPVDLDAKRRDWLNNVVTRILHLFGDPR